MKMTLTYGAAALAAGVMWATAQTETAHIASDLVLITVMVGAMVLAPFALKSN